MNRRPLGSTGIEVSEIGLGAWQLGNTDQWTGPDRETSLRIVDEALTLGVNLFDTAPGYAGGRSEQLLGEALEGRRADVVLVTKFGHKADGSSDWDAARIEPAVEQSLEALRTDYLDVILMHSPPSELLDGTIAAHYREFERLRGAGVVRAYGASVDWGADIDTVVSTTDSQVLEVLLHAFHQEPLAALNNAASRGVGAIVKVPLDSGWLSGRYDKNSRFSDVRSRWTPADIERRAALVEQFRALLPDDVSMPHAALRWLLAQGCVSSVIPGAKSLEQLRENVAAADTALPDATVQAIEALWSKEIQGDPLPW
ncbi:MAG TPA: aldo/keto reductase [Acidothermaceae bacterium]|nr:aldo/keto reductase [Acidothermaceae bacterium]